MAHAFLTALNPPQVIQWCTKVAHPSRREATQTARGRQKQKLNPVGMVDRGHGNLTAYKCKICGGAWHTGHKSKRAR